ncbi:MAG: hypothetical protein R3C32_01215 [Chloroflexota bacterium]
MTQTRATSTRRLGVAAVGSLVLTTAMIGTAMAQDASPAPSITPPPSVAPAKPPALPKPDLPAPEQTSITIGYRLPNLNSRAPFLVALDRGYFTDAGFTDVQLIQTEETAPGLIGGSLNFGQAEAPRHRQQLRRGPAAAGRLRLSELHGQHYCGAARDQDPAGPRRQGHPAGRHPRHARLRPPARVPQGGRLRHHGRPLQRRDRGRWLQRVGAAVP